MGIFAIIVILAVIAIAGIGSYLNKDQPLARYKRDGEPQDAVAVVTLTKAVPTTNDTTPKA